MADAQIIPFPRYSHVYNPWDEAWHNMPAFAQVRPTDTTRWYQLCDPDKSMTNSEYHTSFGEDEPDLCPKCLAKMKEDDPDGIIYNY